MHLLGPGTDFSWDHMGPTVLLGSRDAHEACYIWPACSTRRKECRALFGIVLCLRVALVPVPAWWPGTCGQVPPRPED